MRILHDFGNNTTNQYKLYDEKRAEIWFYKFI